METAFQLIALLTLAGAVAAMCLRKPIHCALCAAVSFTGLAATFLLLQAEFIAFAQILVYVGAIAILVVFAMLLTRNTDSEGGTLWSSPGWAGLFIGGLALLALAIAAVSSRLLPVPAQTLPPISVQGIGQVLMTRYVLVLEVIGLLLTAALIGGVIIAWREKPSPPKE